MERWIEIKLWNQERTATTIRRLFSLRKCNVTRLRSTNQDVDLFEEKDLIFFFFFGELERNFSNRKRSQSEMFNQNHRDVLRKFLFLLPVNLSMRPNQKVCCFSSRRDELD